MIQLYKTQQLNGNLWLSFLLVAIIGNQFLQQLLFEQVNFSLFGLRDSYLAILLSFVVIFLVSSLINNICNRFQLFDSPSNLPAAITIVLSSFIVDKFHINRWMIVLLLFVFVINKLLKAYQKNKPEPNFFDCAFLVGIISIFYPELSLFIFALFFGVFIVTIPKLRHFTIITIGFLMPWILWSTYLFVIDDLAWFVEQFNFIQMQLTHFYTFNWFLIHHEVVILISLGILSSLFWFRRTHLMYHLQKPVLLCASAFLLISIVTFLLFINLGQSIIISMISSLSVLLSYFLIYTFKNLAKLLFYMLVAYALFFPWINTLNQIL